MLPASGDWRAQSSLRPIVRPGAPRFYADLSLEGHASGTTALLTLPFLAVLLIGGIGIGLVSPPAAVAFIGATIALFMAFYARARRDVVASPDWRCDGKKIDGAGFQLLADIDSRFAYAEQHIEELPTGISWPEVAGDVRALLWEAAQHAAAVTELDHETTDLRYADPGTPQAALKHRVDERRAAHWDVLRGIQWEAETLARVAGNAAAAAQVALLRTGSVTALEQVTPSRRAYVAAGALAEARQRLELLAGVWSELDDTGTIAAEELRSTDP